MSRCDRGLHYFSDPGHLDTLRNIVTTYVWEHLDTGYMQVLYCTVLYCTVLYCIVTTYVWEHLDTGYMQVLTTPNMSSGSQTKVE